MQVVFTIKRNPFLIRALSNAFVFLGGILAWSYLNNVSNISNSDVQIS